MIVQHRGAQVDEPVEPLGPGEHPAEAVRAVEMVRDGAAQAAEHYEITRYGTLTAWAKAMGHSNVAKLLHANLNEEKATDKKLNTLAKTKVNKKAIARRPKKPTRAEREAMMQATVGIPARISRTGLTTLRTRGVAYSLR